MVCEQQLQESEQLSFDIQHMFDELEEVQEGITCDHNTVVPTHVSFVQQLHSHHVLNQNNTRSSLLMPLGLNLDIPDLIETWENQLLVPTATVPTTRHPHLIQQHDHHHQWLNTTHTAHKHGPAFVTATSPSNTTQQITPHHFKLLHRHPDFPATSKIQKSKRGSVLNHRHGISTLFDPCRGSKGLKKRYLTTLGNTSGRQYRMFRCYW